MALLFWIGSGDPRRDAMEGAQSLPGPKIFAFYPLFTIELPHLLFFSSGSWRRKKCGAQARGPADGGRISRCAFSTRTHAARSNPSPHPSHRPFPWLTPSHSTRTCGQTGNLYEEARRQFRGQSECQQRARAHGRGTVTRRTSTSTDRTRLVCMCVRYVSRERGSRVRHGQSAPPCLWPGRLCVWIGSRVCIYEIVRAHRVSQWRKSEDALYWNQCRKCKGRIYAGNNRSSPLLQTV